jgi:putative membrane-bound dehydrogenase-like protein
LNSELDHNRLWIHAYANHCPGYIPSERVLGEGGYEAGGAMIYYDLPGPYAPGLEDRVVQSVTDQLRHLRIQTPSESDQGRQQLPQHSPQSSLDAIEAAHGLQVELVAAEPLVESPVAIAFALDGSLWVAEMFDYPAGVDGNFGPGGRVKRLEDRNRDGQYDHATVFLQNIPFPTGVTVWRDGLLVCAAPDILFARDTTGDGVADDVQTLFHGFGTDNYQARVNSLEYGLDGWVYGSCGLFGGTITTPQHRNIELGNRDFRIDPDHGILEPASGRTQQGRVRNDLGDWFGCDNGQFIYHYPLPDHYLRRNPYSNASSGAHAILRGDDALRVYPLATPTLYQLSGPAGVATAACGLGIYRDDYLGESFAGNAFTCEPVNNLVTRRCLVERGTSWDAVRAGDETGIDIVRSRDTWFRPVQARTGPDGALWIVDMHRQVIEHPRWIPAGTLEQLEVRAGANTGRIYRVVRRDQSPDAMLVSSTGDPQDLVSQLASRNGTRRDLATMALTWMSDEQRPPLVQRLREVVDAPSSDLHLLHALVVLDAWHQLRDTDILTALRHPSSWMRAHALRWSEGRAVEGGPMEDAMLQLASDPHPRVRLQAAFSLGAIDSPRAADAIARLLAGSLPDDHIHAAAISSLRPANLTAVIGAVMQHVADHPNEHDTEHDSPLLDGELCRHAAAFGMPAAASPILDARKAFGAGSCDGLRLLIDVFEGHRMAGLDADRLATQLPELSRAMERSRDVVADDKQLESLRLIAVRLLGTSTILPEQNADVLLQMLTPRTTPPLQLAVIDALGRIGDAKIADHLVRSWPTFGPTLRARIVDAMISREGWARKLAEAIANETIGQGECSLQQQIALLEHSDSSVRQVAAACFTAQPDPAPNVSDLREHLDAMEQSEHADSSAGRQIFAQKCATCHRLGDQGEPLGPDIANYANKPADAFALSITRPNAAVDPRYVSYTAITSDGRIATGMIVDESSNAVVIQGADAKRVTLNRREIEELQSTGRSLMPDGFANELSPAAMRDLWAFVKQSAATQGQLSDQIVE